MWQRLRNPIKRSLSTRRFLFDDRTYGVLALLVTIPAVIFADKKEAIFECFLGCLLVEKGEGRRDYSRLES